MADFVNKYFEMDPKTDDLLRSGKELEDGMKVLLEVPDYRLPLYEKDGVIETPKGDEQLAQARKWNRWVTVSNLGWGGMDTCSFIGVYDDGTKKLIEVPDMLAWYVKNSSIPKTIDELDEMDKKDLQERGRPVEPSATRIWPDGRNPGSSTYDQMEA